MKSTFSPIESNRFRLPERNPSPSPTSSSREPTPQAIPNMVRKERSLCAQRVCRVWPKMSKITRTLHYRGLSRGGTPIVRRTRARRENSLEYWPAASRSRKPEDGLQIFVPNAAPVGYSLPDDDSGLDRIAGRPSV